MLRIVMPKDWERVDQARFLVVAIGELEGLWRCVLWNSHAYMVELGYRSPILATADLLEKTPGIYIAEFSDIEPFGQCVIGVVPRTGKTIPITVSGILLGISTQTPLLRDPPHRDLRFRFPVPIVRTTCSNFQHADYDVPVIITSACDLQQDRPGCEPVITILYEVEQHDARSCMLLEHCIGVGTDDFEKEFAASVWSTAPGYVALFRDADLYMVQGLIITSDGIWSDTSAAALVSNDKFDLYKNLFIKDNKIGIADYSIPKFPEDRIVFMLGNAGFGNFAHWMMNSLLAAYLLKEQIIKNNGILLSPPLPDFARQSLRLLGLESYIMEMKDHAYRVKHLVYPSQLATHANMKPSKNVTTMVEEIKQAATANVDYTSIPALDFIFLTRQGFPSSRVMTNEADLVSGLAELGFISVATHDLSFIERVRLFSRAKIIVAQLGAALSHILFAPKDCVVVEITTASWHSNEYWYLSNLLSLRFIRLMLPVETKNFTNHGNFSFDVPITQVLKIISDIKTTSATDDSMGTHA